MGVRGTFYRFLFHVINIRIYASLLAHGTIDEKRNQCFLTLKQYLNKNKLINFFSLKGDGRQQKNKQRNCSTKKVRDAGSTKSFSNITEQHKYFCPDFGFRVKFYLICISCKRSGLQIYQFWFLLIVSLDRGSLCFVLFLSWLRHCMGC